MPELPEVETVVRSLRPRLLHRQLGEVRLSKFSLREKWNPKWNALLPGKEIVSIERRGKWILLALADGSHLSVHLGMTGRLLINSAAEAAKPHTHFQANLLSSTEELRFVDPRRFGALWYAAAGSDTRFPAEAAMGPEPWQLTPGGFQEAVQAAKRSIKAILLDQSIIAGVGNIYADEALFQSRVHPTLLGSNLKPPHIEKLRKAILKVLERAIEKHGSTIINFYYGDEESGGFQNEFMVYDRYEAPCKRCKTAIQRIRLAGRSTHFCPLCQPG